MIDIEAVQARLRAHNMEVWAACLPAQIASALHQPHGHLPTWQRAFELLPAVEATTFDVQESTVRVGEAIDLDATQHRVLLDSLKMLMPWRKGPYSIFGQFIDTEWRSDWKWQRLIDGIAPLEGRTVLDVGCGNGYHCWRMTGAGASLVIGIDPSLLFLHQFKVMQKYIGSDLPVHLLPVGIEHLPENLQSFDTVFSMGVLYHRRSPIDHIQELMRALKPGGQLVLETLVIEGNAEQVLVPEGRYAKMRNVWFIPSVAALKNWLARAGLKDITVVDVTVTSIEEQRPTDWMTFESLPDFLDPENTNLTIEGHPAPIRAVITATCAN